MIPHTKYVPLRSETPTTGSSTTNDKLSSDGKFDSAVTNQDVKELSSNRYVGDPNSSQNRNNYSQEASTSQSNRNSEGRSVANSLNDTEPESTSQSNRNIERRSVANSLNDTEPESTSQSNRNRLKDGALLTA